MVKKLIIFILALLFFLPAKTDSVLAAELMSPYLQAVGKNSAYVLVNTDNQNPVTVQYGETDNYGFTAQPAEIASVKKNASGEIASYVQKIKLANLKSNTVYHYKTSGSADYVFRTAPNEGTSFRFAWMSDFQGHNNAVFDQITAHVKNYQPSFSLYGGDLADNAYRFKDDFFRPEQLSLITRVPFFLTVGNHDVFTAVSGADPNFNNVRAYTRSPDSASGTQDYYSFDWGDLHVLVLNYMVDHAIGSAQYNFAQRDLSSTNKRWKIVINHAPAYAYVKNEYGMDNALQKMTTNIFEPNGVNLVISGHIHLYQRNLVNGINHVVLSSAGASLRDPSSAGGFRTQKSLKTYNFGIFDVSPTSLVMKAYNENNQEIETVTLRTSAPSVTPSLIPTPSLTPIPSPTPPPPLPTSTPIPNPGSVSTLPIYDNSGQGIFQCHSNNNINYDYVKGGGIIVRWDKLQPNNGDTLDQTALAELVNAIKRGNKKVYLHFQIYYPNGDKNDSRILPEWLYPLIQTVTTKDTSTRSYGEHPVPWDLVYQEKLGNFLQLLSAALKKEGVLDKVEYLEPAAGGMWGSTHLWVTVRELCNFAAAAGCNISNCGGLPESKDASYCDDFSGVWQCLGAKFNEGVNAVFEKYLAAFPDHAIMRMGGSCLCGSLCNYSGANYMLDKYGMRFMVKGAGIGEGSTGTGCGMNENLGELCHNKDKITKCGEEPWLYSKVCGGGYGGFDSSTGCGYKNTYNVSLNRERISYYCIYSQDLGCNAVDPGSGEKINDINRWLAGRVGAQISIVQKGLDANRKSVNSPLTINITWQNNGSAPLVGHLKQGVKWVPAGYKLFVEFVKNGTVAYYQEFDLNPSTNQWATLPASTPSSTSTTFDIPAVLGGESESSENVYRIYFGLTDPAGEGKRFALRNDGSDNDQTNRRYLLTDSFTVVGKNSNFCQCPSDKLLKSKGNANCDGYIDGLDLDIWRKEKKGIFTTRTADFNCDGTVDILDLMLWRENRGQ